MQKEKLKGVFGVSDPAYGGIFDFSLTGSPEAIRPVGVNTP
jgi:hypothetical protein